MNRRTALAGSIVLGIVALMLAGTAVATGEPKVLVAAIVVAAIALLLATQVRKGSAP